MKPFVVGVIATFRRPNELARLLHSLENAGTGLGAVIVVDNDNDPAIQKIVEGASCNPRYVASSVNLGCGGALALGEKTALKIFGAQLTHIWILDDDVVVTRDSLQQLIEEMAIENADLAVPMILDSDWKVGWPSGLADPRKFRALLEVSTQEEFLQHCGRKPVPLDWTQGICVLVTRRSIEELGFHRTDHWLRGEDFEFSLRITARYGGVFVPGAAVQHLMPPATQTPESTEMEYRKQCAMVQNVTFIGLHLPHGRRIARYIPGRFYRHFRNWGISGKVLRDSLRILWQGAIMHRPAGHPDLDWPMPRH